MPASLAWTVNDHDGPMVVMLRGDLRLTEVAPLRRALLKCLAGQPEALLVDLSRVATADRSALSVFVAVARQTARWPGTPLVLCGAPPEIAASLRGRAGLMSIHESVPVALRTVREGGTMSPSMTDQLLPLRGAVRHARNMVTEACSRWDLPDMVWPASLVADELVGNGVEHAGTIMTLHISRRKHFLHLAVGDGSLDPPRLRLPVPLAAPHGRGLLLVDAVATHWGWLPAGYGKVVWASLSVGNR